MQHPLTAFKFTLWFADRLVEGLSDARLADLPAPGMNHPAWILGHLALGADYGVLLSGGELRADAKYLATFGPGSKAVAQRGNFPSLVDLLTRLKEDYARCETALAGASPERWQGPNTTPFFPAQFPLAGDLMVHLLTTHAAFHIGQFSAWRRFYGHPPVLGI